MELGAADSPGCYVHVQILGETDEPPFPHSIPIPRLPSLFVTPMSAVEFVLGELFQDRWARVAGANDHFAMFWRARQRTRLEKLFAWFQDHMHNPRSSPWVGIKEGKPQGSILL
jgi:hypothetical protein